MVASVFYIIYFLYGDTRGKLCTDWWPWHKLSTPIALLVHNFIGHAWIAEIIKALMLDSPGFWQEKFHHNYSYQTFVLHISTIKCSDSFLNILHPCFSQDEFLNKYIFLFKKINCLGRLHEWLGNIIKLFYELSIYFKIYIFHFMSSTWLYSEIL